MTSKYAEAVALMAEHMPHFDRDEVAAMMEAHERARRAAKIRAFKAQNVVHIASRETSPGHPTERSEQ